MIEHDNAKAKEILHSFLNDRTANDKVEKFVDVFPNAGYEDHEQGSPDDFVRVQKAVRPTMSDNEHKRMAYYVGKKYGPSATEILSMGVELLKSNAKAFAETDPEYFDIVTGVLSGRLLE
jgi:hypothetical protein